MVQSHLALLEQCPSFDRLVLFAATKEALSAPLEGKSDEDEGDGVPLEEASGKVSKATVIAAAWTSNQQ